MQFMWPWRYKPEGNIFSEAIASSLLGPVVSLSLCVNCSSLQQNEINWKSLNWKEIKLCTDDSLNSISRGLLKLFCLLSFLTFLTSSPLHSSLCAPACKYVCVCARARACVWCARNVILCLYTILFLQAYVYICKFDRICKALFAYPYRWDTVL